MDDVVDRQLALLGDPVCRTVLRYLRCVETATVDHLAAVLSSSYADVPIDQLRIELHHCCLPALDDGGVVAYDPVTQRVEYNGSRTIEKILSVIPAEPTENTLLDKAEAEH